MPASPDFQDLAPEFINAALQDAKQAEDPDDVELKERKRPFGRLPMFSGLYH